MNPWTLGQKVRYTGIIRREAFPYRRKWVRRSAEGEGILVGLRTLSNGRMSPEEDFYGRTFYVYEADEAVKAAIVVDHLRRAPFHVLLEDLEAA